MMTMIWKVIKYADIPVIIIILLSLILKKVKANTHDESEHQTSSITNYMLPTRKS